MYIHVYSFNKIVNLICSTSFGLLYLGLVLSLFSAVTDDGVNLQTVNLQRCYQAIATGKPGKKKISFSRFVRENTFFLKFKFIEYYKI